MATSTKRLATAAALLTLLAVLRASAQPTRCQDFRVLVQANLDLTVPPPGIPWTGVARGFLGGNEPLIGTLSYLPGSIGTQHGTVGHEANDRAKLDFGANGVFVTAPHRAVFPLRPSVPDPFAFGAYSATAAVVPDPAYSTGRFANATGNISIAGTFLVDFVSDQSAGIWNARITGKLCNVQ